MYIISVLLFVFWAFVFIAAGNRLYEVIKYREKVSFKDWVLMVGCLCLPIVNYIDKFLINTR